MLQSSLQMLKLRKKKGIEPQKAETMFYCMTSTHLSSL